MEPTSGSGVSHTSVARWQSTPISSQSASVVQGRGPGGKTNSPHSPSRLLASSPHWKLARRCPDGDHSERNISASIRSPGDAVMLLEGVIGTPLIFTALRDNVGFCCPE